MWDEAQRMRQAISQWWTERCKPNLRNAAKWLRSTDGKIAACVVLLLLAFVLQLGHRRRTLVFEAGQADRAELEQQQQQSRLLQGHKTGAGATGSIEACVAQVDGDDRHSCFFALLEQSPAGSPFSLALEEYIDCQEQPECDAYMKLTWRARGGGTVQQSRQMRVAEVLPKSAYKKWFRTCQHLLIITAAPGDAHNMQLQISSSLKLFWAMTVACVREFQRSGPKGLNPFCHHFIYAGSHSRTLTEFAEHIASTAPSA